MLHDLVRKRAIAGVFITAHNIDGLSPARIGERIRSLQDIRAGQGLPPLWMATDQEGGTSLSLPWPKAALRYVGIRGKYLVISA